MKKYLSAILLGLIQMPLLVSVFFLNYNNIFKLSISPLFRSIIAVYFLLSLTLIIFLKKLGNKSYIKEFSQGSLIFIFFLIPGLFIISSFIAYETDQSNIILRASGRAAFLYLGLALTISPIISLLKGKGSVFLLQCRKYLGILSFLFFAKHGIDYILMEYGFYEFYYTNQFSFLHYFIKNLYTRYDVVIGIVGGFLMFLLGISSNNFSYSLLGKAWKGLHYLVYPAFLISLIHIAFAGRFDGFYILLFVLVVGLRFIVFIKDFGKATIQGYGPTTKYICVVCGYIYDEAKGDPDGGIVAGTKFEDIPDSWVCPVCKVTKKDFIPYYENSSQIQAETAEILQINYLTKDVIELTLSLESNLKIVPGQFIKLILTDFDGEFSRSYSVSEINGTECKFLIKIKESGRGGKVWKTLKVGDKIGIGGAFGNFIVQNTTNPKVFIATGTGLSPIYNMMRSLPQGSSKVLYFGVARKEDLFYEQQLQQISGIELNYFLSREELEGYNYGRIKLKEHDQKTEFYICGNPDMTQQMVEYLEKNGYQNIYFEKFL